MIRSVGPAAENHSRGAARSAGKPSFRRLVLQPIALILPPLPRLKIIDVGAAATERPAYDKLMKALPCDVIGFEPIEAECDKLNAFNLPGHRYLPHAIADGTRRTFYEC